MEVQRKIAQSELTTQSEVMQAVSKPKKADKLRDWLSDKHNLAFVGIFLFAIIIRLYYFFLTKNQPLWWDEADYLAYAKNLAGFPVDWVVTPEHKSILSFVMAAFFKIGLSEAAGKFILQVIPSILAVFIAYFICLEMYKDKRIALIVTFLFATFWEHLFDTFRFHVDITGLFTGLLAIYVFWRGYENEKNILGIDKKWAIPIAALLVMLTYSIRRGHFIFGVFILVYVLSTRKFSSLTKDKHNWIALALAIPILYVLEKTVFASGEVGFGAVSTYFQSELPIRLLPLQAFSAYFDSSGVGPSILLYLFFIGAAIVLLNIALSFGNVKNTAKTKTRADLFNVIAVIFTLAFFIYIIRAQNAFGEARWYFPFLLSVLIIVSRGALEITDFIKPYSKHLAVILLIAMIGFGGYYELKHGDFIIKNKVGSFEGIKQAALFVKAISNDDDIIISKGEPQVMYYSERRAVQPSRLVGWTGNDVPFDQTLEKIKETPEAKYMIVSFSEPNHPPWMQRVYQTEAGMVWEIPFMQTKIDFSTGEQDIKQSITYDNITFTLINIIQEVFIYEISRS